MRARLSVPWSHVRIAVSILVIVLVCAACGPATTRPDAVADPEQRAAELAAAGSHGLAAEEYLKLAELYPKRSAYYHLRAADAYLDAGSIDAAKQIIADTGSAGESADDAAYRRLLRARAALIGNRPDEALSLSGSLPADSPAELRALRHRIRAGAAERKGEYLDAARDRIALLSLADAPARREANLRQLWKDLNAIDLPRLKRHVETPDDMLRSWVELAIINRTQLAQPEILRRSLESWIAARPAHPAIPAITGEMLLQSQRYDVSPEHIALLLPLSGPYAAAARAIRDGFIAAWYESDEIKPAISVYDTGPLDIAARYQEAVDAGVDFVVGPLEKPAIDSLVRTGNISVPTLALNHLDEPAPDYRPGAAFSEAPDLYQFGLSPENEAREAAHRAWTNGHVRALVISPDDDWGSRVAGAFVQEWRSLGGSVLEYTAYPPGTNDFSAPVRRLLNVDSSEARATLLRQRLSRQLQSAARLRQDADVIFMAAQPLAARQIVPQFRFFQADSLSVYASSHVFTGNVNAQVDSDMNGVMFPDMPWVLDPPASPLALSMNRNWNVESSSLRRLYAFGIDAFRIIPHLGHLALEPDAVFDGETGRLQMSRDGAIYRKLMWARFVDGMPRLLDAGRVE